MRARCRSRPGTQTSAKMRSVAGAAARSDPKQPRRDPYAQFVQWPHRTFGKKKVLDNRALLRYKISTLDFCVGAIGSTHRPLHLLFPSEREIRSGPPGSSSSSPKAVAARAITVLEVQAHAGKGLGPGRGLSSGPRGGSGPDDLIDPRRQS